MRRVRICEIAPSGMDRINKMCIMPGSEPEVTLTVLRESKEFEQAVKKRLAAKGLH